MRDKVIIIKTFANLAKYITLAEFERVNADHVVLITALRRPQFLPQEVLDSTLMIDDIRYQPEKVLEHWRVTEMYHLLIAEYASVAVDHGSNDIRVVEGKSLETPWYFEAVRSMHRQFGQQIVEVDVVRHDKYNHITEVKVDDKTLELGQFIEMFKPHPSLG